MEHGAGVLFTGRERPFRLGYFPDTDTLTYASADGRLKLSLTNPPVPVPDGQHLVLEGQDLYATVSPSGLYLHHDPMQDATAPRADQEPTQQDRTPTRTPLEAQAPQPTSTKEPRLAVSGVLTTPITFKTIKNRLKADSEQEIGEFRVSQTEPPPPPDNPEIKVTVYKSRGAVIRLRNQVAEGKLKPGVSVELTGYPKKDYVYTDKTGRERIQRQFTAIVVQSQP